MADVERLRRRTQTDGPGPYERSERRMRVALLAPADSPHTRRWVEFYAGQGIEVYAISLPAGTAAGTAGGEPGPLPTRVRTAHLPTLRGDVPSPRAVTRLRALLDQARPDVIAVHLGGPYGLLAALADRHPYVVLAGADLTADLGVSSAAGRRTLELALRRADAVCATSRLLAAAVGRHTDRPVSVTPVGVDTDRFVPAPRPPDGRFLIGTVPAPRAGLDRQLLERAHQELTDRPGADPADLVVLGSAEAGLPGALARLDALVVGTDRDGRALVALQGQACGVPVVAAGTGALAEYVRDGETGFVVPPDDPTTLADRLAALRDDPVRRARMGAAARDHAVTSYTWVRNATLMLDVFAGLGRGGS
ncbi:glycosyltransferase [Sporichthya polymorpha]|uniref:glycosyltransferase n=1 Tax=Sporichthya polymorpha TaxID=35751 RepID=UPI000362B1D3|nr:glycosyltransferase [Sporichthya polymorpha]